MSAIINELNETMEIAKRTSSEIERVRIQRDALLKASSSLLIRVLYMWKYWRAIAVCGMWAVWALIAKINNWDPGVQSAFWSLSAYHFAVSVVRMFQRAMMEDKFDKMTIDEKSEVIERMMK